MIKYLFTNDGKVLSFDTLGSGLQAWESGDFFGWQRVDTSGETRYKLGGEIKRSQCNGEISLEEAILRDYEESKSDYRKDLQDETLNL